MDSDTVLTCRGDWESPACQGVSDILYLWPEQRIKHTQGFIRNHTLVAGDAPVCEFISELWQAMRFPIWPNSGVVVLNAADRIPFAKLWLEWLDLIDKQSAKGEVVGDEAACMFARHVYNLPLLPPAFNGLCKWQPIFDWHQLIHADGNVTGEKRLPYIRAVEKVLDGGDVEELP
jgi:hypothetical protein